MTPLNRSVPVDTMDEIEAIGYPVAGGRRRIKKRALRNKSVCIEFDPKDLKDFVTGFHKRKKKRQKEAKKKLHEKERLHRIEERKKRKHEREAALFGHVISDEGIQALGPDNDECNHSSDEDSLVKSTSIFGEKVYQSNDVSITVTTKKLSEDDVQWLPVPLVAHQTKRMHGVAVKKKFNGSARVKVKKRKFSQYWKGKRKH